MSARTATAAAAGTSGVADLRPGPQARRAPRLRRVSPSAPGLTRRRRGRGFEYLDADRRRISDPAVLQRIRDLAIPPAWQDVWICPDPRGHLQAVGTDAKGRRQYLYHPLWREHRDRHKHARVVEMGRRLPAARRCVADQLGGRGLGRERALAAVFRLLDLGLFRVGGEEYAEENGSFGLATLLREHVTVHAGERLTFEYTAKAGRPRRIMITDPAVHRVVAAMARARRPDEQLFGYREGGRWHDITAADINAYLHQLLGDVTAKDFRTWHGTVLAAAELARERQAAADAGKLPMSERSRRRAVGSAIRRVSEYLGNTPAVCRASYVDPRLIDLFAEGRTIRPAPRRPAAGPGDRTSLRLAGPADPLDDLHPADHALVERAVIRLLGNPSG